MHLARKRCNLKRWRKYTGTCVDDKSNSALCAETSKTMQHCYNFAGRRKGTLIRIEQVLNSTGSMDGIAWLTVCWGVMVCNHSWTCRWRWFLPLRHPCPSNCTLSHPKQGISNVLGQQESRIAYIHVRRIVMLCCWVGNSQHFKGL